MTVFKQPLSRNANLEIIQLFHKVQPSNMADIKKRPVRKNMKHQRECSNTFYNHTFLLIFLWVIYCQGVRDSF